MKTCKHYNSNIPEDFEDTLEDKEYDRKLELEHATQNMNDFIHDFGIEAFNRAIYLGMYVEYQYDFIHPKEHLKQVKNFEIIQRACINANV